MAKPLISFPGSAFVCVSHLGFYEIGFICFTAHQTLINILYTNGWHGFQKAQVARLQFNVVGFDRNKSKQEKSYRGCAEFDVGSLRNGHEWTLTINLLNVKTFKRTDSNTSTKKIVTGLAFMKQIRHPQFFPTEFNGITLGGQEIVIFGPQSPSSYILQGSYTVLLAGTRGGLPGSGASAVR